MSMSDVPISVLRDQFSDKGLGVELDIWAAESFDELLEVLKNSDGLQGSRSFYGLATPYTPSCATSAAQGCRARSRAS